MIARKYNIAAPKYFCYLRYTHMNIVFVVFTYSRSDNHFVHGLLPLHPQLCGFRKFGWRKDGFCYFSAGRTADGLKMRNLRSDGRLTGAGVCISRTLSILHHLDLIVLTFGLILLPVILYPRWACSRPCWQMCWSDGTHPINVSVCGVVG